MLIGIFTAGKSSTSVSRARKRVRQTHEVLLMLTSVVYSTFQGWPVEGSRRVARPVSIQKS